MSNFERKLISILSMYDEDDKNIMGLNVKENPALKEDEMFISCGANPENKVFCTNVDFGEDDD